MKQFRLSGTGGQGLILAGIILAEAAVLDGKWAIQSQSYGPESRGGAAKSEVIISEKPIHFPKVTCPDVLLAMSQASALKFIKDLPVDSILITDSQFVKDLPAFSGQIYELPITATAKEKLGGIISANMVALGILNELVGTVSEESLIRAVRERVPKGTEAMNEKAVRIGIELAQQTKGVLTYV